MKGENGESSFRKHLTTCFTTAFDVLFKKSDSFLEDFEL